MVLEGVWRGEPAEEGSRGSGPAADSHEDPTDPQGRDPRRRDRQHPDQGTGRGRKEVGEQEEPDERQQQSQPDLRLFREARPPGRGSGCALGGGALGHGGADAATNITVPAEAGMGAGRVPAPMVRQKRARVAPSGEGSDSTGLTDRRSRALEEPLEARLLSRRAYPLLEVRNPVHRTSYLVMFPEFPSEASAMCTCTDFARRGLGTCKHIVAAERWLRANPDVVPTGHDPIAERRVVDVWKEIDQKLGDIGPGHGADVRKLARPGSSLFDWVAPGLLARSCAQEERKERVGSGATPST